MDSLRPESLLRFGYKDCVLCEVDRKGEERRCRSCSGRVGQRDRLLWEINRRRIRRVAAILSLVYPGLGHFYSGRHFLGLFWAVLIPLSLGLVVNVWQGPTLGHGFLLLAFGLIWYLAWVDAGRGFRETHAPCRAACPSGVNVPDYVALVREGMPLEALALVHDRLPFAAFCGRACPHPCEQKCVRNEWGAPVSIMAIKRYAADIGYAEGILPASEAGEGVPGPKVAVVGAGPAGLSAASTLARLGARVTLFDRHEEPGGMLRYAVAEFRYPREALLSDVRTVLARGVQFRGNARFGTDVTFGTLAAEGFDALLVAAGTGEGLVLPGAGTEEQGFYDALTFLERVRRGERIRLPGKVAVIGGGNVAIDVARTALRMGAADVTLVCLETLETMPAFAWEVSDAVSEGAKILPGAAVKKFSLHKGRVEGFDALRVERIDFDEKGRILPRTVPGSEFAVKADTVVMAIGSRAVLDFLPPAQAWKPLDRERGVFRLIFRERGHRIPVYVCGDCAQGPRTVVEASASGREAALNIYGELCVEEVGKARYRDRFRRRREKQEPDRPGWRTRRGPQRLSPEESRQTFREVENRLTEECARHESERCARCNLEL